MEEKDLKTICEVWEEMNGIRAQDGVPYHYDGRKSDIKQEYWDDMMTRLDDIVKKYTGKGCWLNPILYNKS
jgi:hypothetical protein